MSLASRIVVAILAALPAAPGAVSSAADWPTYQGSNARTGAVAGARSFSGFHRRFQRSVDGQVYAQPLVHRGAIYVATEHNTVYAFAASGGRQIFRRHLGEPVPGGDLPCGNIDPSGITGTPAIAGNRLYVVANLRSGHHHVLYALSARTGRVLMRRTVDTANRIAEQERGALLVAHGRVYVPYGGLLGDCGDYHGYVVSVTEHGGGRRTYRTRNGEAGIWAPGGVAEQRRTGRVLAATGNGRVGEGFGQGNSVVALSPTLGVSAFWAPSDWQSLSASDTDVGSISPTPLPGGLVFQSGKNGVGYLLRRSLGGIGGEIYKSHICGAAFGAAAFSAPYIVVPCADALVALRLSGGRFSVAWRAGGRAGVPIVARDTVIYVDADSGRVRALRLSGGHERASVAVSRGATSFPPVAGAGRLLAVPGDGTVTVYGI